MECVIDLFGHINANTINRKLGQTWARLTSADPIIAFF